ncbi:hypothetical protein P8833_16355 [Bacillus inaquosorum]|uniref:hypothetical protein n=1 Tax=Bacillus inaquosorum TaxID=483913 RepID=UPI00227EC5EF|nr:hypothetical protein [Bacillus inaquosorum]MCY8147732.1 hypothetical protein [Bacillus inaquosorum]MEC0575321.1 hypothetical protein [Bacillus inaquosorum]
MNEYISDKEFQELRLIIVKLADEHNLEMLSLLKDCRTVKELCEELFLLNPFEPYQTNDLINPFTNYLEENMFEVKILKIDIDKPDSKRLVLYKHT